VPTLRKPYALRPGATLGIAAPAFSVDPARVEAGEERLRKAGFRVHRRHDVTDRCGYLAGSDERRAEELAELVADREVEAILCARGGYGCHRIMASLDAGASRRAAKPLAGFSDITTLLLWQLRQAGLVGFHAPMLDVVEGPSEEEFEALLAALSGKDAGAVRQGVPRGGGRGEGVLVGGSLTMLAASLGTPWEVETRGAILLFEDVAEKPYAIYRLLQQLRAAGKLDGLAGVGVGHLTECVDPKRATPTAEEVIEEVTTPLGLPLVLGLPFGHGHPNLPWPVGVRGVLDGESGALHILEAGVNPA
jgi:muramoyltetrapeptide carboxypeptidase